MNDIRLAKLRQDDLMRDVKRARGMGRVRTGDRWWVRSVGRLESWARRRRRLRLVPASAQAAARRAR
ncbi:MAG TPA: hypothetical protein VFW65_12990 [Pseudonocardiaceae bacterium]|nr:hypothetical protein [Pseudonocardiaceae bacterium]